MSDGIMTAIPAVSAFLTAYSSWLAAFALTGQSRKKSAYGALLPGCAALAAFLIPGRAAYAAAAASVLAGFLVLLRLCERRAVAALSGTLTAVSFCLSGQILRAAFPMTPLQTLGAGLAWLLLAGIPVAFGITIFPEGFIPTREQKKNTAYRQIYFFPGTVLLLAWQIFLLASMESLRERAAALFVFTVLWQGTVLLLLRQQVRGLQERLERILDRQYQAELLNFMQVIRSQRHDFNFHAQTLCALIESGRFEECRTYAQSLLRTVRSTNDILPLYHPAVSALLNTFREMALQKGLQMEIEIHDNLQFISTGVYETNTILGNLLQNAIDELELHPELEARTIHVLIIKRGQSNMIKVSNPCHLSPEEMSRIFQPGFTTKKSHEGLGLANALRTAEKYDGTVYPEFEDGVVHFIARIPLKR